MEDVVAFAAVAAVIVVVPGPDMALVLRNGVASGRHAAVATALGINAGLITMGLLWLTGYALLVAKIGVLLRRPSVHRLVNAIAGTVLTALGVRLAFERR